MDRRRPHVDHQVCLESSSCMAHNIDAASFVHRHVNKDCQCDTIGIDEAEMMQILEDGTIPLVSCQLSSARHLSPYLTVAESKSSYTAISHVSSDFVLLN